jgi:DNA-binding NtrC family response regulator
MITAYKLKEQLPKISTNGLVKFEDKNKADLSEREILYKVLFDMKRDLTELKKITFDLIQKQGNNEVIQTANSSLFKEKDDTSILINQNNRAGLIEVEESLSLFEQEKRLIEKSLLKYKGKRKDAAAELGISERTLYRKLKEFGL